MKKEIITIIISLALSSIAYCGTIVGWGHNYYGQATPPDGNDFVAIAAGAFHSYAIKEDGSLISWGNDRWGQVSHTPDGNDFIAIASGGSYHSIAIREDGSIIAWGRIDSGECDIPDSNIGYLKVVGAGGASIGLRKNGSIIAWGTNYYGQCDVPDGNDYIDIAADAYHVVAIKSDGTLVSWGLNNWGQCNVPEGNDFVDIGCAYGEVSFALREDGSIVSWGRTNVYDSQPPNDNGYISIHSSYQGNGFVLKDDGSIVGWGTDYDRILTDIPEGSGFYDIASGDYFALALRGERDKRLVIETEPNFITTTEPYGENMFYTRELVNISASPFVDCPDVWRLGHWEGDFVDVNSPVQNVIMDSDKSLTAVYYQDKRLCGDECHPILQGDVNRDCYINFDDFALYAAMWLSCTHPDCD